MKRDWTSRSTLLVVGLILVVVNVIGLEVFARLDLTDDRVYSLSDASRELTGTLDDPLTVTAWFTDNLPAPYSGNRRFLKDKLDDYASYGGGDFQYRFVDPATDDDARREAQQAGIPPVQIQVIESDNVQVKNAWMGLQLEYGGEREVIPVIEDLSTLEYDITSAMRRLVREERPRVGFTEGHGEIPLSNMQLLAQELRRNYDVELVALADSGLVDVPPVLVVAAPADTLSQRALENLNRHVISGGRVAFFLNRVDADLQAGQAQPLSTGLEDVLSEWGLALRPNLVMDEQSSTIRVQQRQGIFNLQRQILYPFFPLVTNVDESHTMVRRLQDVALFYASTIDTTQALPPGVSRHVVMSSTPRSQTQQDFFFIQPSEEQRRFEGGPYPLAATYVGSFPDALPGEGSSAARQRSPDTRMVLVGDGDFLDESMVGTIPQNLTFALNVVDWLSQDDALLTIRAKDMTPRQLRPVPDGARPLIKYANMLGPVLIVVAIGLVRWRRRRRSTANRNTV